MTRAVLAAFDSAEGLLAAAAEARDERYRIADAFTPYPLEGLDPEAALTGAIGWAAACGGALAAAAMFAMEAWSAALSYPFNSGDRPLFSWPVFLLAPFEIGVLGAAVFGFAAFLWATGLPRLHHPAFDIEGFERASQDRFLLAVAHPSGDERMAALREILDRAGALSVQEAQL